MAVTPTLNPTTVEILLDTTWRVATEEEARRDGLDRKATSLATFVSVAIALSAPLGLRTLGRDAGWWVLTLYGGSLIALLAAVSLAVAVLAPTAPLTLPMVYLERFPKWSQTLKSPNEVRGETTARLIEALARERAANERKTRMARLAFAFLLFALALLVVQASILGFQK